MNNGCKGCENRKVGCHSTCERYLKWKNGVDIKNKKRRESINKYMSSYYHN